MGRGTVKSQMPSKTRRKNLSRDYQIFSNWGRALGLFCAALLHFEAHVILVFFLLVVDIKPILFSFF